MNKTTLKNTLAAVILVTNSVAVAANDLSFITQGQPYSDVKQTLIDKGWAPTPNPKIERSSLYAQEFYETGMTEVMDCISMEIDGCTFQYQKGKQRLEIKTITRQLRVESFRVYKKQAH